MVVIRDGVKDIVKGLNEEANAEEVQEMVQVGWSFFFSKARLFD